MAEAKILHGLKLLEFGNTIQIAGIIMNSSDESYLIPLPDEEILEKVSLPFNTEDWQEFIRQTDLLETEVLANDRDGLKKIILRKSARQVDSKVSWRVYKRDGYKCRYCGRDDIPLTVDHLMTWEEGGPSVEGNLVSSCKKCNKKRGNMEYANWLRSGRYSEVSKGLTDEVKLLNFELQYVLHKIPLKVHVTSRGSKKKKK